MVRIHLPVPRLAVRDLLDSFNGGMGGVFAEEESTTTAEKTAAKTTAATKKTTAAEKTATKTTAKATAKTTSTTATATAKATKHATTSTIAATTAAASETVLTLDTGTPTTSSTTSSTPTTTLATTTTDTAAAATTSAAASGSSPAAKAGIAIGVLAALFFVSLSVFLLFRRRQKQQGQRLDDEKNGPFADSAAITGTRSAGSRMSIGTAVTGDVASAAGAGAAAGAAARPGGNNSNGAAGYPNRRQSSNVGNNAIALQNQAPKVNRGPYSDMHRVPGGPAAWGERPMTSQSQKSNPFGEGAQRLGPPQNSTAVRDNKGMSPMNSDKPLPSSGPSNGAGGSAAAAGAAAASAAGAYAAKNLTRKASIRKDGPQALDLTLATPRGVADSNKNNAKGLSPVPPSPSGTEYSMNSMAPGQSTSASVLGANTGGAAAIAAAGGPAVSAVHRVQLDFKPTLEDELGLRAGQLVRMLHEYDDGWALCIRLDRSQQGVVPRTCLSVRPVKPRPPPGGGANTNPSGRPIPNGNGRPMGPPSQSRAPSLPPMSFGDLPAFNATPSDASRSPSPNSSSRSSTASPAPVAMPTTHAVAVETPAIGIATSTPAPASTMPSYTPGSARVRPVNSIGRKPVPGQAL